MKRLIASSFASLTVVGLVVAAPAQGQPERKTELVELGKSVDRLQLRHDFDSAWVVNNQNLLYRDTSRDYYLVTLKEACEPLDIRSLSFSFHPVSWQLRANRAYEVRPRVGAYCDVAKIEQIDDTKADALRKESNWRVW